MNRHAIPVEELKNFLNHTGKTHNGAPFTLRSKKTGKDYTFKVKQSYFNGFPITHVYVETEYLNFKHLGYYVGHKINGTLYKKVDGQKAVVDSPSAQAISWVLKNVTTGSYDTLKSNVELYHLGSCLKCGKTLTDYESINSGFGPVCRAY